MNRYEIAISGFGQYYAMRTKACIDTVNREIFTVLESWRICLFSELANLTTKIITLLEFFNFVSEVSRLQYK
jgi:hypothetical protein